VAEVGTTLADVVSGGARSALILGDSHQVVSLLCAASAIEGDAGRPFDHTITDPPYDERTHTGARGAGGRLLGLPFESLSIESYLYGLLSVTKRWSIIFCPVESLGIFKRLAGPGYRKGGLWIKPDSAPQFDGKQPAQCAEGIALLHYLIGERAEQDALRWNRGGNRALWVCGRERHECMGPSQKPVKLLILLLEAFTDENDIVFDPFAGWASVGVACLRTGRRYVGIEERAEAYADGLLRLGAEVSYGSPTRMRLGQLALFGRSK